LSRSSSVVSTLNRTWLLIGFHLPANAVKLGSKLIERPLLNRGPDAAHEIGEIPEVVNRIEPRAEHFFHVEQMMQVSPGIPQADRAATGRIDRSVVANILGLFDQDPTEAGKKPAGPAVA